MMKTSLRAAFAVAATMTACVVVAQSTDVYKWTDASGTVHYTDQPPPGRDATRMTVKGVRKHRCPVRRRPPRPQPTHRS